MKRFILSALLCGCSASGLTIPDQPSAPECAWHFSTPMDTSNSIRDPGAATCDAMQFRLDDGWVKLNITHEGTFDAGACAGKGSLVSDKAQGWQVTISECGLIGTITVNGL